MNQSDFRWLPCQSVLCKRISDESSEDRSESSEDSSCAAARYAWMVESETEPSDSDSGSASYSGSKQLMGWDRVPFRALFSARSEISVSPFPFPIRRLDPDLRNLRDLVP